MEEGILNRKAVGWGVRCTGKGKKGEMAKEAPQHLLILNPDFSLKIKSISES